MIDYRYISLEDIKKTDPIGIDKKIQRLQEKLNDSISWLDIPFGRVYPNRNADNDIIPEVYSGNNEYSEVFPDSSLKGMCFFDVDHDYDYNPDTTEEHTADVNIIFFVNVEKAFPDISHRQDEEVKRDIANLFFNYKRGWEYLGLVDGIENVFENFDYKFSQPIVDMQPFYVFAVKSRVKFELLKCD